MKMEVLPIQVHISFRCPKIHNHENHLILLIIPIIYPVWYRAFLPFRRDLAIKRFNDLTGNFCSG